jgi:hypothetical protein
VEVQVYIIIALESYYIRQQTHPSTRDAAETKAAAFHLRLTKRECETLPPMTIIMFVKKKMLISERSSIAMMDAL